MDKKTKIIIGVLAVLLAIILAIFAPERYVADGTTIFIN